RLSGAGFELEVLGADPARPSLLAVHRGRGGGRSLLLNGHVDTVGVAGMSEPFTARIEGDERTGRMTGRGTSDMKSGVAAMVVCAEAAAARGSAGDVLLALVADEENASIGTPAVIDRLRAANALPAGCIVGEPTWLDLPLAHRGYALVDVELRGRAAHSSQPDLGTNALTHLGRLLAAVEQVDRGLAARAPHPQAGHGSLLATLASGGDSNFLVPARASVTLERRTLPGETAADALAEVEDLVAELRRLDPAVDARCRLGLNREPWQAGSGPTSVELLDLFDAALVEAGRPRPDRGGAPYWMESALWEAAGVPTVVCGPAGGGMHAVDEWVDLAALRAYTHALDLVVRRFCG
ncbi:MAG TPA: M20/M25/M40 family metallo-hydrolase, partial [Candidatus Nanopelagicales bacterium]|nr:M20/M25/M40 family metallo-hydrolase [Candidatus Nanopelagicales bacterium]